MTWKRIQTLYIALAGGLIFAMLCCPMCFHGEVSIRFTDNLTVTLFAALILFMTVFMLAIHKRGYLQGKLCIVTLILMLFFQGLIAYWFFKFRSEYTFTVAAVFPLLGAVLLGMAYHYISRDVAREMVDRAFGKRFPKRDFHPENNK